MLRTILLFISIFIISGCSASYKKLKKVKLDENNTFSQYLLSEYKEKATFEAEKMHDWNSAKLYSEKALEALDGKEIKPQKIEYWKLPEDYIFQLKQSYHNLISVYDEGKISDPYNLAVAISSLDCWAEQQEENWQTWDINKCRDDFINAMQNIYSVISNKQKSSLNNVKKNIKETASVVTKNKDNEILQIIYFDFDNYNLSYDSINILSKFLDNYKKEISKFIIIGHTDTKGTKEYNFKLSLKRAETVKNLLIKKGIKEKNINVVGKGEELLAVLTEDETAHSANRRVEIKTLN